MADAQVLIGQVTLASNQATVVFSNIPQIYRDLVLVTSTRSTTASVEDYGYMYFNGDTTNSNYSRIDLVGNGSTATTGTSANLIPITSVGGGGVANVWSIQKMSIVDYTQTNKFKNVLMISNSPSSTMVIETGRWASLNAITSMSLVNYSGAAFATGSTFTLYGVLG